MLCDSHFRISTQYFALLPQGLNPIFSSLSLPPLFAGFLSHSKSSLGWDFPRKTGSHLVQIHCKSPRLLFFSFFFFGLFLFSVVLRFVLECIHVGLCLLVSFMCVCWLLLLGLCLCGLFSVLYLVYSVEQMRIHTWECFNLWKQLLDVGKTEIMSSGMDLELQICILEANLMVLMVVDHGSRLRKSLYR